jgi:hypothetical protein
MPKPPKPTNNTSVKAGNKKNFRQPPKASAENQARREAGQKQFTAKISLSVKENKMHLSKEGKLTSKLVDTPVAFGWDKTASRCSQIHTITTRRTISE